MTDLFEPEGPDETGRGAGPVWRRLAWFAGLALMSLAVVAVFAYALRALLFVG
ncbi:MAG: hypothetical protein RIB03_02475 [Henriciella sp.]|uniref:hypothetical protein n=1 Tax=Henriciella sp. TaxID=1968823 RepID=UPI002621C0A0|nr:hypothetical protein [Henriciella sp.]